MHKVTRYLKENRAAWLLESLSRFSQETGIIWTYQSQPHDEMCAEMESMIPEMGTGKKQKRKLYLAPRYTYKSSLLECFVIYLILKYPNIAILILRATSDSAMDMLTNIKSFLTTNPVILEVWGDLSKDAEKWSESRIIVNTRTRPSRDPTILAAGIDVPTTGMHPDVIFLDDIVVRENCDSIKLMQKARVALQSCYPLLPPWGTMLVTGTRWSNIDVYSWILSRNQTQRDKNEQPAYEEYIRSCYIYKHDVETGKEIKDLFFPARLSEAFLEDQRKDLEARYFASWYYNQTYEAGLKPFSSLKFFDGVYYSGPVKHVELTDETMANERIPLHVALIVDPALTASASSDSFGVVVLGFDANGDWLVFEGLELRMLPSAATDELISLLTTYEPDTLLIESANADVTMVARLQDAIRNNKLKCSVISYSALQDEKRGERGKAQRIGALEPLFRNGKVWIKRGSCRELVQQLDLYPGVEHDDVIDALAMGRKAFALAPKIETSIKDEGLEKPDPWHELVGWRQGNEPKVPKGGWTGPGAVGY